MAQRIFITGGTGYIGSALLPILVARGHHVRALARPGSEDRLPGNVEAVVADPLETGAYAHHVPPSDTFVHLIGVAHRSPAEATKFWDVDFVAAQVALKSAVDAGVRHFVYLSVAQPAPVRKAHLAVRAGCEAAIRESKMPATFLRPWKALGPGHRWPYALLPLYWILEHLPLTREGASRMGLVTLTQMLHALVWAVENPPAGVQILDVPGIRACQIQRAAAEGE